MPSDTQRRRMEVKKARIMQESLGTRVAAGYLRNRGWSLEGAVAILCIY